MSDFHFLLKVFFFIFPRLVLASLIIPLQFVCFCFLFCCSDLSFHEKEMMLLILDVKIKDLRETE